MGRPRQTPRLDDLQPNDVAQHVVSQLVAHIELLARFSPRLGNNRLHNIATVETLASVAALTRWAQNGNTDDREVAVVTLKVLTNVLFSSPLVPVEIAHVNPQDIACDPAFDVKEITQLVLAAASGRLKIERKLPVPAIQLAALVGFDRSRIRQLIRTGVLRRTKVTQKSGRQMDAPIVPSDARKLLASRCIVRDDPDENPTQRRQDLPASSGRSQQRP